MMEESFFKTSFVSQQLKSGLDSLIEYTMYECQEGDRPDVVADNIQE